MHATAAHRSRGVGEGDSEVVRRAGLQLIRAKGWMDEPDDAEQVFRIYSHHQRARPPCGVLRPMRWALAAAIGGRIREADRWCSKAAAQTSIRRLTHRVPGAAARSRCDRPRAVDNDSARRSIENCARCQHADLHSLRAMAEVELAMGLITTTARRRRAKLENVVVHG